MGAGSGGAVLVLWSCMRCCSEHLCLRREIAIVTVFFTILFLLLLYNHIGKTHCSTVPNKGLGKVDHKVLQFMS